MLFQTLILSQVLTSNSCPDIRLQTDPPVNITEYIRSTWYIQQQQVNGYQSKDQLYCVTATYNKDNHSNVPFFNGTVISVYNYANQGSVNGGNVAPMPNNSFLCARVPNASSPEKLYVAPCFLPNLFGGPYWIVLAGPSSSNYEWAIVSGGQPSVRDSNYTCTTKEYGFMGSGLWLFSRKPVLEDENLRYLHYELEKRNVSTSRLLNVSQVGCNYTGAFIKH